MGMYMSEGFSPISNLTKQLSSFFEVLPEDIHHIEQYHQRAFARAMSCFQKINNKYYQAFKLTHSGQYAAFLYFLSHEIFKNIGRNDTSEKIYYLNKIMHSIDLFYEVALPDNFHWEHPVGTVLGRGVYGDYFTVYQNCTIGGSWDKDGKLHYPKLGKSVTLYSYACILGNCTIGENVIIASHTYVLNQDIPDNSIVFGQSPNLTIKPNKNQNTTFNITASS